MYRFSNRSIEKLETCHNDLQIICNETIKYIDFSIIYGFRNEKDQNIAFQENKSTKEWPDSKHNILPSLAVDTAPYPIIWPEVGDCKALARFYYLGGYILGIANKFGIKLRWGGDWNRNGKILDQKFDDLGHFELI